jgi:tRNA pseudouridine38-40 synthase
LLSEHFNSLSKIVLILEYDGRRYSGFQWQKGRPTIQASLEEAIFKTTGENRRVITASRTDAGVHARFQVGSFRSGTRLPASTLVRALNFHLPHDIAVKACEVGASFNVRGDVIGREYEYLIYHSRTRSPLMEGLALQVPWELDLDMMNEACSMLKGKHDFISFAAAAGRDRGTVKTITSAGFERDGNSITFRIKANSFLMHQVRNTLGTLLGIGSGRKTIEELKQLLGGGRPGIAGPAVAACGLYLTRVYYPKDLELKYENLFNQSI